MSPASDSLVSVLRANLGQLQQRIAAACQRSNRSPDSVQLVAVTKYASPEELAGLIACGQRILGENRPQQLIERAQQFQPSSDTSTSGAALQWHLIGQLQSNKIRSVLPWVAMIHSIDSLKQVQRISRIAAELELMPRLLLQVNVSGEESKGGFSPAQLREDWESLCNLPHIELAGLMTMAPLIEDQKAICATFRGLRELRFELQIRAPQQPLSELSMGMSHDFEIAIEEGATLIRVGSLLLEGCESA